MERAVHGTYSDLRAPTVQDEVHPCSGEVVPGDGRCPVPAQPDVAQVEQLWSSLTSFCDLMRRDAHLNMCKSLPPACRLHQGGPPVAVLELTASPPLPVQHIAQTAFTRLEEI